MCLLLLGHGSPRPALLDSPVAAAEQTVGRRLQGCTLPLSAAVECRAERERERDVIPIQP